MKKAGVLFVRVLVLCFCFTSCSKDDDPSTTASVEGKWNFDKSTVTSNGLTIDYPTQYFKNEPLCDKDYIEIMSGDIVKYGNYTYTTTCVFEEKVGMWSQSGKTILISVAGTNFNGAFDVVSLSATDLQLEINGTYLGQSGTLKLYFTK